MRKIYCKWLDTTYESVAAASRATGYGHSYICLMAKEGRGFSYADEIDYNTCEVYCKELEIKFDNVAEVQEKFNIKNKRNVVDAIKNGTPCRGMHLEVYNGQKIR